MAVGDVVSGISSTGIVYVQPAAGVELCITTAVAWGNYVAMTDGAVSQNVMQTNNGAVANTVTSGASNQKIFLTNTVYLKIPHISGSSAYTGIQIK